MLSLMGKQTNITLIYFINFIKMQDSQLLKCRKFKCLGIQPNMYITMFLILLSDFVFIYQFIILLAGDKPYLIPIIILKVIASLLQFAALCMTFNTNPGKVPQHWMLFYSIIPQQKRRYCLVCKQFKPLRTHHCSLCEKCVLNMDHHCPWVSNCVGLNNRKFFLLFLTFIIVDHIFCLGFGLPLQIIKGIEVVTAHTIIRLLSILLCLLIVVPVVMFTGLHMQMAFNNQTTIQDMKKNMKSQSTKEVQQYQYNIGCYDNFTQVCGINSLCWCCPLNPELQIDGVEWPSLTKNGNIKIVK